MIDTIKIRFRCSEETLRKIEKKSNEFRSYDHKEGKMRFQIFKSMPLLGSYYYGVAVTPSVKSAFVELSLPKYMQNQNILMLDSTKWVEALEKLHHDIQSYFDIEIEPVKDWQLYRLDACYAWKFANENVANYIVNYLKNLNYGRKKTAFYQTSVMFVGSDFSAKFYMKKPEYEKHDFRRIEKTDRYLAYEYLKISEGVLRFEATLRKKHIDDIFTREDNIYTILQEKVILSIIKRMIKQIIKLEPKVMSYATAFDIIKSNTKTNQRARDIYNAYRLYTSEEPSDRDVFRDYPRATRYRYIKIFRDLRLGIPEAGKRLSFDLSVPSKIAVGPNFDPLVTQGESLTDETPAYKSINIYKGEV